MASGKARCTRKLRNWVVEQVESENFPGVRWDDDAKTMFRIPWKHAGKQDFRQDQDAGFFKAWAIFKGKYKEGDAEGPATWKTRLRCALNKSPEFEEVPERGHMDGAEPYKVYRLLPPGTLAAQPDTQKSPSKRHHSSIPSAGEEEEEEEETMKKHRLGPFWVQEPLSQERGASREADHTEMGRSSSSESSSDSPTPQEGVNTTDEPFQEDEGSLDLELPQNSDYSLLLTFIYNGRVVRETQVHALDCRLVAEPLSSQSNMEQVFFPRPDPPEPTQHLLNQLEKGLMVASNPQGLFVQRLCPLHISWDSPENPPGPGPHLLPSNKCVKLFKTDCFLKDVAKYKQGLGPPPKYQVTLNFWEESPGPNHTSQNLITVQLEQAFARHLLQETREEQTATLALVPSLEEDTPDSSPLFLLFPLEKSIAHTEDLPSSVHSQRLYVTATSLNSPLYTGW